jgi:SAM-dependent methyltransferase
VSAASDAGLRAEELAEFRRKNAALYDETQGALWDAIVYDGIHQGRHFINLGGDKLLQLATAWVAARPSRVLDLGTGHGDAAFHWLDTGTAHVTAVDINENQLRGARERAADRESSGRIEFVLADMNEWQPAHPYDLVTSWDVLMLLPDARSLMRVVHDALGPGGTFVASTFFAGDRLTDALRTRLWEEDGMATLLTPSDYASLAGERGLGMIGYEDLTGLAVQNSERMLTVMERLSAEDVVGSSPATLASWRDMGHVYLRALASREVTYGAFALRRLTSD